MTRKTKTIKHKRIPPNFPPQKDTAQFKNELRILPLYNMATEQTWQLMNAKKSTSQRPLGKMGKIKK